MRTLAGIVGAIAGFFDFLNIAWIVLLPVYGYEVKILTEAGVVRRTFRGGDWSSLNDFLIDFPEEELMEFRYWYRWSPDRIAVLFEDLGE
jgi:hypothetical protein